MKKTLLPLLAGSLLLAACTGSAMHRDCLEKKSQVERTAALAGTELQLGLTTQEVRALLGEPSEIIAVKGTGGLETWKYYLNPSCRSYLAENPPVTDLLFLEGRLVKWLTYVR